MRIVQCTLKWLLGVRTLWRQTERTDLGGERGGGTDFTTRRTEVDDLNLGGIELGSWSVVSLAVTADQKDDTHAWLVRKVVNRI